MIAALRLLVILSVFVAVLFWWRLGWQSAALLAIGALISGTSLWEWLRLMSAVMTRMDAGESARPIGIVLVGFFLRLGLTVVILYVSLRYIDGAVYALAVGLGLGVLSLTLEGLRLMKRWTL